MDDKFKQKREELAKELIMQGISDNNVLDAIRKVPRHLFVNPGDKDSAYLNIPLTIAQGQTISQPYTIAVMLQALELKKGETVLEIGTCSGYNAVLISEIVGEDGFVYTTEIVPGLIEISKKNIEKLKIKNIKIIETDGSQGWKENSPYDKIIITAACPEIPKPLIEQLKFGGIVVAPVGPVFGQKMVKLTKLKKGFKEEYLGEFMFVPLKGKYGY